MLKRMMWTIILTLRRDCGFGANAAADFASTRAMIREGGGWRYAFSTKFIHAYFYGRWTKQYIGWAVRYTFPRVNPVEGKRYWGRWVSWQNPPDRTGAGVDQRQ